LRCRFCGLAFGQNARGAPTQSAHPALLHTEILLISRKSEHQRERWVYLDAGRYNGLDETFGERIRYRLRTPRDGGACGPVVLAGLTCDSEDILYRRRPYQLPLDLAIGDTVDFLSAGAYTASVVAVGFNGFARSRPILPEDNQKRRRR
jgi:ornithine decarboxylase